MPAQVGSMVILPFIVSTDRQKLDPQTRRLIRSHVMRGKNREKPKKKPKSSMHITKAIDSTVLDDPTWPLNITRLFSSKFSAIRFADSVDPVLIDDLLSFVSISHRAMFLLAPCIIPDESEMTRAWFTPLLFDPAYLYACCFTIQGYFDGYLSRTRSLESQRKDYVYYAKTVAILQERLAINSDNLRLSDSTIMTVLSLYGHAYTVGDHETANLHIKGLLKLVSMRGVDTFVHNTRMVIEVIRCDLVMAVDSGSKPVLFSYDDIPWSLTLNDESMGTAPEIDCWKESNCKASGFTARLNPTLAMIWTSMSEFCTLINSAAEQRGSKIPEQLFLHSMGSIMYRLLHHRFAKGSLDEAVRLGLLAFASPIFLNWNRVELQDRRFTTAFRQGLVELSLTNPDVESQNLLWLLMVAALSMSHEPDAVAWLKPWLQMNMEICNVLVWADLKDALESFMWIGLVYDQPGRDVYNSIPLPSVEEKIRQLKS